MNAAEYEHLHEEDARELAALRAERDALADTIARIRLYCENQGDRFRHHAGRILEIADRADDHVVIRDEIRIPRPAVPFGPAGIPADEATASCLRDVVRKIDGGYANVGGSNVTQTVRKLLADAAEQLHPGD